MNDLYGISGNVKSLSIEMAEVVRSGFTWKEADRLFHSHLIYNPLGLVTEKRLKNEIIHIIYNPDGLPQQESLFTSQKELIRQEIYHYDDQNTLTHCETVDKEGKILKKTSFQTDRERRLTVQRSSDTLLVKKFSPDGKLKVEQSYDGESLEQEIQYQYNDLNQLSLLIYNNSEGEQLRTTRYSYNEQGLLSEEKSISSDNIIITHDIYSYSNFFRENWMKCIRYTVSEDNHKISEIPVEVIYRAMTFSGDQPPEDSAEGSLTFPNGSYKGTLKGGQMHGSGLFSYSNGSVYRGEFRDGQLTGQGEFQWKDGKFYKGSFLNGTMEGEGYCRWSNGDEYKGEFHKGQMHGIGVFTWKSGDRFYGLFENNKRSDQGLFEPSGKTATEEQ